MYPVGQLFGSGFSAKRCKPKHTAFISGDYPLHQPVAYTALAIKVNNTVWHKCGVG